MSQEIPDIEERLKSLLSKVNELFRPGPPQDHEIQPPPVDRVETASPNTAEDIPKVIPNGDPQAPEAQKAPMLLQGPEIKILLEPAPQGPGIVDVDPPAPAIIILPEPSSPAPDEPALTGAVSGTLEPSPEEAEIPFLIGCPDTMLESAKELQENLERLKPKFTKMKFHLRGRGTIPYPQDHSLMEAITKRMQDLQNGVLLLIMTHRLSGKTPHPLAAEAVQRGVYFQEVLPESISKKAFYFDFLLGLVFFLKSQKAPPAGADSEPPDDGGTVGEIGPEKRG
jgi:hypothetical protein